MSYLLIGQAPSRDGTDGFRGQSGRRLAAMAGVEHEDFLDLFERRNLLDRYPGDAGVGDLFPRQAARERWVRDFWPYLDWWPGGVVLVGKAVATSAGYHRHPFAEWMMEGIESRTQLAWIPHPSGVNRLYNQPEVEAKVSAFLQEMVADVREERSTLCR